MGIPMISPRPLLMVLVASIVFALTPPLHAMEALRPGAKIDNLTAGAVTYTQVQVRSYNARTLMITHAGGMASIHLRDLTPEWQTRFNYNPTAAAAADVADKARLVPAPIKRTVHAFVNPGQTTMERLLLQFGTPATVQPVIDLRPKFIELELHVKNQGIQPSCAVFAVVSALEFQNAQLTHQADKFSEEYLIWATRRTIQRPAGISRPAETEMPEDVDEGFSLNEVVSALRAYGVPLQASMPYLAGVKTNTPAEPPPAVITEARNHRHISIITLPGRDAATRLNNLIHALNAGVPVPVGLAWPNYKTIRVPYLSEQIPLEKSGHAVTLVGYESATGRIEDALFVFKNSWGQSWGQGGYGKVTYGYLSKHLQEAVLLDVQRG